LRAQKVLEADLLRQLQAGELIASGFRWPVAPNSGREDVAADLWELLQLRIPTNEVVGNGLRMGQVRIRRAGQPDQVNSAGPEPDLPTPAGKKRPGPHTLMPVIEQELRARAQRSELKNSLSDECRALENWARSKYPEHKRPPKAKSIMNALRQIYAETKPTLDTRV